MVAGRMENEDVYDGSLTESDDDFVKPTKKLKFDHKRKEVGAEVAGHIRIGGMRIRVRNTPHNMMDVIRALTPGQRKTVEEIGFSSMLSMNIKTVPTMLGYWLVINYDHRTSILDVGAKKIQITEELVRDVLGIPMGETEVRCVDRADSRFREITEWRLQFGADKGTYNVSYPIKKVKESGGNGRLFILNFLVIFATIMGRTTKGTTCTMSFLPALQDGVCVSSLNWCRYILNCLKETRGRWSTTEHYNGPLTLLAVCEAFSLIL